MVRLTCPALNSPTLYHGFFTRNGGCSPGRYHSLNCGVGSGDDPENVAHNRAAIRSDINQPGARLCGLDQIHSTIVYSVDEPWQEESAPPGDAMVTDRKNIALAIITADCAPLLLADLGHGIIGAAHAGWKGALNGIVENTIETMCRLGADRRHIIAAVGPCIGQKNYQVGPEFRTEFIRQNIDYRIFFLQDNEKDRYLFDLKQFLSHRLTRAGLANISLLPHDTYADSDRFFSYRRMTHQGEKDYGRQISVIMLL